MVAIKDQVFVLTIVPYRDADLIVNFLSRLNGKISAVIYRGRKIGKSSSFPFQAGDLIEMEYQKSENRDFVSVINTAGKQGLRLEQFDYDRFVFHSYLIEIVSRVSKPELPEEELFVLLQKVYYHSWNKASQFSFIAWVLWKILKAGGYQFDFSSCHHCHKVTWKTDTNGSPVFRKQAYFLDHDTGTITCGDCRQEAITSSRLSPAMLKLIWLFETTEFDSESFNNLPCDYTVPLSRCLNAYLLKSFDLNPKSLPAFISLLEACR